MTFAQYSEVTSSDFMSVFTDAFSFKNTEGKKITKKIFV